jgi:hypothetical protein
LAIGVCELVSVRRVDHAFQVVAELLVLLGLAEDDERRRRPIRAEMP